MKPKSQKRTAITVIVVSLAMWLVLWLMILSGGCASPMGIFRHRTEQSDSTSSAVTESPPTLLDRAQTILGSQHDTKIIERTVRSTDYLMTLFIVVMVLGVIAGLHGLKSGWLAAAGCIAGAGMKAAFSLTSVYLLSGLIFLGVILAVVVLMTVRTIKMKAVKAETMQAAFKDVVGTVQRVKAYLGSEPTTSTAAPVFSDALEMTRSILSSQKPETQQLVAEVKKYL